ncbi:response regulator [Nocardia yamanashiensis]|uniref:response regulator n=1 Tax=Nocardia yamanashiensis TaxID=209247 RepID=UPI001E320868|nr:response regulator [Nocardia yamanashiensis]UGT44244.1 response regulator [Nocardia yamanashiensis]
MSQLPYSTKKSTIATERVGERPSRVLVVDSNPAMAEIAALVLGKAGHEVRVAPSGEQAVAVSRRWSPDLVLLELALPDVSGTRLCRVLRQEVQVPVIAFSLDGDPEEIRELFAAGAFGYLPKPFRTTELLDRVRACLTPRLSA